MPPLSRARNSQTLSSGRVNDLTWHWHEIFRVCVKFITTRVLQNTAKLGALPRFVQDSPEKIMGRGTVRHLSPCKCQSWGSAAFRATDLPLNLPFLQPSREEHYFSMYFHSFLAGFSSLQVHPRDPRTCAHTEHILGIRRYHSWSLVSETLIISSGGL